jgi:hypothetical protein
MSENLPLRYLIDRTTTLYGQRYSTSPWMRSVGAVHERPIRQIMALRKDRKRSALLRIATALLLPAPRG